MPRRSIEPNAFELRDSTCALHGGYSPTSQKFHFPRQPVCPYTGVDDVVPVELSANGALWGWTVVTSAPPGYVGPVPFGFGVVELAQEQLRIVSRIQIDDPGAVQFGDPMELCADVVGHDDDGTDVVTWAFRRVDS